MKLDQALVQSVIDGSFGLPLAYENEDYTPTAGTAYAALTVSENEKRGFTLNDTDSITGYLQINLKYPLGATAITAKSKAADIFAAYPIGKVLTYSGQSLEITGTHRVSAAPVDGWYEIALRINFEAYLAR